MAQETTEPQTGQEPGKPQDPPAGGDPKPGQEPEPKTFDADYVKKLREEAANYRTEAQAAKAKVQEFEDRDKTDQQRKDDAAKAAEKRATDAESKLLRFEVAAEKGIPAKHAHRLAGSTKEELAKDAEELAKELKAEDAGPDFGSGARESAAPTGSFDDLIRKRAAQV